MPSHLANWMNEEKRKIKARNKRINDMLKSDDLGNMVDYELPDKDKTVKDCKACKKGNCKKHKGKK